MSVVALPVTVRALRAEVGTLLDHAGVDRPHDEARDLIAAVLDKPRFWAVEHADEVLDGEAIRAAAYRRARGMPFAYAVGKAAFRHLTVNVDERVLIPRQETELLVELVLTRTSGRGVVADIGCGSACIALALATEGEFERVIASDISEDALVVARCNVGAQPGLNCPVELRSGDLLQTLRPADCIAAIVSNPPYIARHEMNSLPASVIDWEPHQALESDNEGLAHTFQIIADASRVLQPGGLLAFEVDSRRAQRVAGQLRASGFSGVTVHDDFSGRERYVLGARPL
ncbi:MAG: peptide chain release factor N(5)-glutamine methyltransferase [Gemmatimonadota bacterium]